jgi:hypothetical protein
VVEQRVCPNNGTPHGLGYSKENTARLGRKSTNTLEIEFFRKAEFKRFINNNLIKKLIELELKPGSSLKFLWPRGNMNCGEARLFCLIWNSQTKLLAVKLR